MRTIFVFIAYIFSISSFILSFLFYNQYTIELDDLEIEKGQIAEAPQFSKDEYGNITSMKLMVEGEKSLLRIPGQILRISNPLIYQLKKGDEIYFHQKKACKRKIIEPHLAYSLMSNNIKLYTKNDALNVFKSGKTFMFCAYFLAKGVGIISYIYFKNKIG